MDIKFNISHLKIHKNGISLRPIVNTVDSSIYRNSVKYLASFHLSISFSKQSYQQVSGTALLWVILFSSHQPSLFSPMVDKSYYILRAYNQTPTLGFITEIKIKGFASFWQHISISLWLALVVAKFQYQKLINYKTEVFTTTATVKTNKLS